MPAASFAILTCDTSPPATIAGSPVHPLPYPDWSAMTADDWQTILGNVDSDFLAIGSLPIDSGVQSFADRLSTAVAQLEANSRMSAVLCPCGLERSDSSTAPASFTVLRFPPGPAATAVIRVQSLQEVPLQADIGNPLLEWLLRQSQAGTDAVRVMPTTGFLSPVDCRPIAVLAPTEPDRSLNWLADACRTFVKSLPAHTDRTSRTALLAGLLQQHDFLDASHSASQSIEGQGRDHNGDYWHAIMHRREPDYGNSKYWFRRVGQHPVFGELARTASRLPKEMTENTSLPMVSGDTWDALAFVDFCQTAARSGNADTVRLAEHLQWQEMQWLLQHTWNCLG